MVNAPDPTETTQWMAAIFCPQCQTTFLPPPEIRIPTCPSCGREVPASAVDPADDEDEFDLNCAVRPGEFNAEIQPEALLGRSLDLYEISSLLGMGAMGWVYLARHRRLHRSCALKILSPKRIREDPHFVNRFLDEGRAAAALVHSNIVTVHAIGEDSGFYFLEMEFVAGRSLRRLIEEEGPLSPERATAVTLRIAEGLAAAHKAGILHRDLKPDNVLLTHQRVPKIVDFGLARRTLLPAGAHGDRQEFVGTPAYMAPELYHGHPATPATDVYALGVSFFQMLTGRCPFEGDDIAELRQKILQDGIPTLRDRCPAVPLEIVECLHQMMAKTPENRPQSGIEAAQLLEAVLGQAEDLESLVQRAFRDHPEIEWRPSLAGFDVRLRLPGNRGQKVFIELSSPAAAEQHVTIGSLCCEAVPAYYETALRLNSEILHGALAIRQMAGESLFVVLDNYPRSTIDPEEIRRSVIEVAHRADAIEKLLTGGDTN
jgi:serine/threonine-protein kinase